MSNKVTQLLTKGLLLFAVCSLAYLVTNNLFTVKSGVSTEIAVRSYETNNSPTVSDVVAKTIKIRSIQPDPSRVVSLTGEIGTNVDAIVQQLQRLSKESDEPIYLLIDSPGGSVIHGSTVVSAIESSSAPVYTVCMRICASMAFIIHQYGHKRMMVNRAVLMSHDASGGAQGDMSRMKSLIDFLHKYIERNSAFIANRAGMKLVDYKSEIMRDMWLDAISATERNFNDQIVSLNLARPQTEQFDYSNKNKQKSRAIDLYGIKL